MLRLAFILALVLTTSASLALAGPPIVLVHGSFVGAWYWDPVVEGLEDRGHDVIAVELTGFGAREVADPAAVTLNDHIRDVVAAIEAMPGKVVLVAHSYGGRPATGAWDIARDRIAAVILLEAVAPSGTGPLALPYEAAQRTALEAAFPDAVAAGALPVPAYVAKRYPDRPLAPQSIQALHAAVPLTRGALPDTPGAYVIGSNSTARLFRTYARTVQTERGWEIWEIETGHDMVHDNADVVTRLIDKLSRELTGASSD
jgi:pimeloyl-ACP methyl ester carboxylesterase